MAVYIIILTLFCNFKFIWKAEEEMSTDYSPNACNSQDLCRLKARSPEFHSDLWEAASEAGWGLEPRRFDKGVAIPTQAAS